MSDEYMDKSLVSWFI